MMFRTPRPLFAARPADPDDGYLTLRYVAEDTTEARVEVTRAPLRAEFAVELLEQPGSASEVLEYDAETGIITITADNGTWRYAEAGRTAAPLPGSAGVVYAVRIEQPDGP